MDDIQWRQAGLKTPVDNLIVHVAKCLREDISIPFGVHIDLRQAPINNDDHDSWAEENGLDTWYYVAYSVIRSVDRAIADAALTDLVATGSKAAAESLESAQVPLNTERKE